jgi:hypothetical protein
LFGFSAVKRPPGPKKRLEVLKEMIALDMELNEAAELPGLGIGTGQERSVRLTTSLLPPQLEPID